jgi:type 2 lantibiotic biosynthesis protein LanM
MYFKDAMRAQLYIPLLEKYKINIEQELESLVSSKISVNKIINKIYSHVSVSLDQIVLPIIAKEIYKAKKNNLLEGSTPLQRYESFFIRNNKWTPSFINIIKQYPLLVETLDIFIATSFKSLSECLVNFKINHADIEKWLNKKITFLLDIKIASSDRHRNGKQVFFLTCNSNIKLVYKHTNLMPDILFQEFIKLLNLTPPYNFYDLKILNYNTHGWLEYLDLTPCKSLQNLESYYKRAGSLLAITDTLNYCDGHFENLIAYGGYPVLIDCETMFQYMGDIEDPALTERSILFTGLIQKAENEYSGRGYSAALQVRGKERTQYLYTHPINDRTDELQVRFKCINYEHSHNSPIYNGLFQTPLKFMDEVIEGFIHTYNTIMSKKQDIIKNNNFWEEVSKTPVRQLIRHTMYYMLILRKIQQPEGFISKGKTKKIITSLLKTKVSKINRLIDYEITSLLNIDIPYFYHYPNCNDLFDGNNIYRNFFKRTALDEIYENFETMSLKYRDRQIEILKKQLPSSPSPIPINE